MQSIQYRPMQRVDNSGNVDNDTTANDNNTSVSKVTMPTLTTVRAITSQNTADTKRSSNIHTSNIHNI